MAEPVTDTRIATAANTRPAEIRNGTRLRIFREVELVVPAGFLLLLVLACFVWPDVHHIPNPVKGNLDEIDLRPFSPHHIFGTDSVGQDIFSRILYGGRVSLEVGLGSTAIGLVVGGAIGMFAGYRSGALEIGIMRVLEVFLAFPSIVLAIVVATYLGPSELHVIWAISFFGIPYFGRLARANTLRLRELDFIVAARLSGSRGLRVLGHLIPNVLPPLMTFGLLGVGIAVIVEASLSYLGLGVPAPGPSWGNMISVGQQNLNADPDLVIIPGAFLFATVLALQLLSDALRSKWAET